jgi:curved DNA-binding protein CbpA
MVKYKPDITKNNLSWESQKNIRICDFENCKEKGKFKAPKSRMKLNEYFIFCLKHVTNYNKSWDFYKGLNVDQIELSMRKDTVWDRPSWPLKGGADRIMSQLKDFLEDDFTLSEKEADFKNFLKNKIYEDNLSNEEAKSLKILGLMMPISIEEVKKNYKKLVKIFHPDVNDNNKIAEKKFKEINEAYRILLKKFKKTKI